MSPVSGRKVLITRAESDSLQWAHQLRALGAEPIIFPCIVCSLEDDPAIASRLAAALRSATWLVLCSRRAVQAVAALMAQSDSRLPGTVRVACVGPGTEAQAQQLLGRSDLRATGGTAASLCAELGKILDTSDQVIAALTDRSDQDIEEGLSATGASVQRINVYSSAPSPAQKERTDLADLGVDVALLASPSAVTGLLNRAILPKSLRLISIGPTTSAAVRDAGLTLFAEAQSRGLDAMLQTLETSS